MLFDGKFKRIGKDCGIVYARGRIEIFKRRFQTDFYFCEFNWEITIFRNAIYVSKAWRLIRE